MAKNDIVSGLVMFVFGLVMLIYVIPNEIVEGGDYTISPALLPKISAIGITALAAILVAKAGAKLKSGEAEREEPEWRPMRWAPAAVALTTVAAAVAIFRFIHPAPAVLFLVFTLMIYMGERRWPLLIGLPLVLLGLGYVLFYEILGMVVR